MTEATSRYPNTGPMWAKKLSKASSNAMRDFIRWDLMGYPATLATPSHLDRIALLRILSDCKTFSREMGTKECQVVIGEDRRSIYGELTEAPKRVGDDSILTILDRGTTEDHAGRVVKSVSRIVAVVAIDLDNHECASRIGYSLSGGRVIDVPQYSTGRFTITSELTEVFDENIKRRLEATEHQMTSTYKTNMSGVSLGYWAEPLSKVGTMRGTLDFGPGRVWRDFPADLMVGYVTELNFA